MLLSGPGRLLSETAGTAAGWTGWITGIGAAAGAAGGDGTDFIKAANSAGEKLFSMYSLPWLLYI